MMNPSPRRPSSTSRADTRGARCQAIRAAIDGSVSWGSVAVRHCFRLGLGLLNHDKLSLAAVIEALILPTGHDAALQPPREPDRVRNFNFFWPQFQPRPASQQPFQLQFKLRM